MDQLEIARSESKLPGVPVFSLTGPFTLSTKIPFESMLQDAALQGTIIEMSSVSYMDSAGLGMLLRQFSHTQRAGQKFALAGISERVRKILEITHTDKILPMFASVAEAEKALANGEV